MTKEGIIRLMINKSYAYKAGFKRAVEDGNAEAADKWKAGYQVIKERIDELKELPASDTVS